MRSKRETHTIAGAKFSRVTAPARAPYLHPPGNAEIDYFGFKLIVHILIKGCLGIFREFSLTQTWKSVKRRKPWLHNGLHNTHHSPIGQDMSISDTFATTSDSLTTRTGLLASVQLMDNPGLSACVDRHFPQPGSNRGLSPSVYVRTLILTQHTGEFRLDDVDRFQRNNKALLPILDLEHVPGAAAIGKWLRRMGAVENMQETLNEVNRVLLATSLRHCKAVMLRRYFAAPTESAITSRLSRWYCSGKPGAAREGT